MSDDPNEYVRVTDRDLSRHVTVRRSELPHGNYSDPLKQDATDINGDPLPPEFDITSGQSSAAPKKESTNG